MASRRRVAVRRRIGRRLARKAGQAMGRWARSAYRRYWTQHVAVGGPMPYHPQYRPGRPQQPARSQTSQTNSRRHMMTVRTTTATTPIRRGITAEADAIRRAGLALADWTPADATDIHGQIAGLALGLTNLAGGLLHAIETLQAVGVDARRILAPLTGAAVTIGEVGADLTKVDKAFVRLYPGLLMQEEAGEVAPLDFRRAA